MRIINVITGEDISIGDRFYGAGDDELQLVEVEDRFLTGRVKMRTKKGVTFWGPLIIRFTHPLFFMQRVGFIPT